MNSDYQKPAVEKVKTTMPVEWHRRGDTERRHHVSREPYGANEERADVFDTHALHVFQDTDAAGDWVVWLNTISSDFDGLVLGMGKTRNEAIGRAVAVVEAIERILQGPAPITEP